MKTAVQRLEQPVGQYASRDLDRALALLSARVASLETKVEQMAAARVEFRMGNFSKLDQLRAACDGLAIPVSADGYIRETHAARLLNRAATTLRNWRYAERPLRYRLLGGRIEYRLGDLAAFLAERGED